MGDRAEKPVTLCQQQIEKQSNLAMMEHSRARGSHGQQQGWVQHPGSPAASTPCWQTTADVGLGLSRAQAMLRSALHSSWMVAGQNIPSLFPLVT